MGDQDQLYRELGEIKGLITGMRDQMNGQRADLQALKSDMGKQYTDLSSSLGKMDDRLRAVERSGAVAGAVTGGVVAVGVGLIKGMLGKIV